MPESPRGFASTLEDSWSHRGPLSVLLRPFSWLFGAITAFRRLCFHTGLRSVHHAPVPVIVVGNITVGGSGKTPLVIALLDALKDAGFTPGLVSRGYGGTRCDAAYADSPSADVDGDEVALISRRTSAPIAVGRDRVGAIRALLAARAEVNVIVSDDGLQHYPMARDIEIAMFDERGAGNGLLLPGGPLRESLGRLRSVNAIVINDAPTDSTFAQGLTIHTDAPVYRTTLVAQPVWHLGDSHETRALESFAAHPVAAVAGIGHPDRFFDMLRRFGIVVTGLARTDHEPYDTNPFETIDAMTILITEKDAVKCSRWPDPRVWVVPVRATVDPTLFAMILEKLHARQ